MGDNSSDLNQVSPRDIALAVDGFNRAPGLRPTERQVGIELVGHFNKITGRCDPSEARLAILLGVSDRAIRQTKALLRKRELINWVSSGPNGSCQYEISWHVLANIADDAKRRATEARAEQTFRSNGTTVPDHPEQTFLQTIPILSQ